LTLGVEVHKIRKISLCTLNCFMLKLKGHQIHWRPKKFVLTYCILVQ